MSETTKTELLAALTAEVYAWRAADTYCDILGYVYGDYDADPQHDAAGSTHREAIRAARDASDAAGFPSRTAILESTLYTTPEVWESHEKAELTPRPAI